MKSDRDAWCSCFWIGVHPLKVNGEPIKEDLGELAPDYVSR